MILGRVVDSVVSTVKHPTLQAWAVFVVQPIDAHGADAGESFLAVDHAQSGPGDVVLVLCEGNGIRQVLRDPKSPIRRVIVAVVDDVTLAEAGAA